LQDKRGAEGYWWETECGARDGIPETKHHLHGPVNFTIKMKE